MNAAWRSPGLARLLLTLPQAGDSFVSRALAFPVSPMVPHVMSVPCPCVTSGLSAYSRYAKLGPGFREEEVDGVDSAALLRGGRGCFPLALAGAEGQQSLRTAGDQGSEAAATVLAWVAAGTQTPLAVSHPALV